MHNEMSGSEDSARLGCDCHNGVNSLINEMRQAGWPAAFLKCS